MSSVADPLSSVEDVWSLAQDDWEEVSSIADITAGIAMGDGSLPIAEEMASVRAAMVGPVGSFPSVVVGLKNDVILLQPFAASRRSFCR